MPKIDLTNQIFGRLTVIKENGRDNSGKIMWLCKCSCGNEKTIRGNDLRSGKILSCGCLGKEIRKQKRLEFLENKQDNPSFYNDLSGKIFGKLTVLEFDKEETIKKRGKSNNQYSYWKCQCECGNIIVVSSVNLTQKKTQSCGCLKKEKAKELMKSIQPLGAQAHFQDLTGKEFNNILVLKRYEANTSYNKPQWVCKCFCGNVFITNGNSLKNGDTKSCGCIGKSYGENLIKQLLEENQISFSREVKFNDLKDEGYLRFDFAILDDKGLISKLIEFDGRQHSDINSIWYTDTVIKHDQLKNDYCKEHNIPLLRISYTDIDKITIEYLLNETS